MVLSRGNTEDLEKIYDAWLGGKPSIEPMLKDRGLKETGTELAELSDIGELACTACTWRVGRLAGWRN